MKKTFFIATIGAVALTLSGCDDDDYEGDPAIRDYSAQFAPLPQPTFPLDNLYSDAKAELGELLFWDPILSANQDIACASCHHPDFGWADGRALSIGTGGHGIGPERVGDSVTPIHSPTILNMAYTGMTMETGTEFVSGPYFWDLRADTLEAQALGPIQNPIEMLGDEVSADEIFAIIEERLQANNEYQTLFNDAFGPDSITIDNVAKAIATFERTITGQHSRFDAFLAGDHEVFTEQEVIGLNAFIDSGCADCHSGPMLSDNNLDPEKVVLRDLGAVRTPSLRNINQTAPYMQDGSHASLGAVIGLYEDRGDLGTGDDDGFVGIEAFLKTLDSDFYRGIPESVPSGLPVGGDI